MVVGSVAGYLEEALVENCVEVCSCVGVCNSLVSRMAVVIGPFLTKSLEEVRRNLLQGVELACRWV